MLNYINFIIWIFILLDIISFQPTKRRRIVESEEEKDSSEAELGDALDFNETQSHLQEVSIYRSQVSIYRFCFEI